ncbi:MAG: glutamine--tRNA ligase/YqeY domain fusion protein [Fimbriimonadaceae bacterium]|nr:glutamine--tRNA ligase/YqeY domain fusion protein [Fimbriimonadaceae bacterium]QYK59559.1 MAG: glutamine--tRNA ligase/YqeY domain fusion protein [Fimbriimonadaceae bacterium]
MPTSDPEAPVATDFVREAVSEDLASGRFDRVHTRFPPEPNAYLHIGHAKAVWIDYGVAKDFGGRFNLRFDDTNPEKEDQEFVDAIIADMKWLLSADPDVHRHWDGQALFGSDYFDRQYELAQELIKKGLAYVCDLSPDEMREARGTLTRPGVDSPWRNRSVEENLDLFARMRAGEFPDGSKTLRAKIDMASPNLVLRDPVMYRIRRAHHHRQGDAWCVYPTYDWAHGLQDSIEGITHSLCTLEYEIHRPLYDWFLDQLGVFHPRQIEFARLNLTHTVMSKRKFVELVKAGKVSGYDDPRMPTLAGLRRRGYSPEAVREFCRRVGVTKAASVTEMYQLEDCAREDLNRRALRVMAVLDPLRVVITNYDDVKTEWVEAVNNPEDPSAGMRRVPFGPVILIEQDDFREEPPPKYFRLSPGTEVRLRYAYLLRCDEVVKDGEGQVVELRCTVDPATLGANPPDGRKVKATIHWVVADQALEAEARLFDHLFSAPHPEAEDSEPDSGEPGYLKHMNPDSLRVVKALVEPSVAGAAPGSVFQFERVGYFCVDRDSTAEKLVFNRTVTLRDTWAKIEKKLS